jgi:hypothetical protein
MRRTLLSAAAVPACVLAIAAPPRQEKPPRIKPGAKNLVANGDFEAGTDTPAGWQKIDSLTTFWVKDPDGKRGKVLKFDTDVLQSQAYDWWVKIAGTAKAKDAPKKLPTTPPKYDTLAGLDGVWYWSDPFPLEKGKAYWLTLDVKGAEIMAWLVGYPEKPDTSFGADAKAFQEYFREKRRANRARTSAVSTRSWRSMITVASSRRAAPMSGAPTRAAPCRSGRRRTRRTSSTAASCCCPTGPPASTTWITSASSRSRTGKESEAVFP